MLQNLGSRLHEKLADPGFVTAAHINGANNSRLVEENDCGQGVYTALASEGPIPTQPVTRRRPLRHSHLL